MRRRAGFGSCGVAVFALLLGGSAPLAFGQGLRNVIQSQSRVFPGIGPGVAALKRDSSGKYYILAQPADRIFVFDSAGKPAGQIPNANSRGASIRYAVDIDVDSHDRLFVADRGANAVEVFASDGLLIATVPVVAPTSVVALPDDQFAVTTLQSSRLVQVMNEKGKVVRSFGDPGDEPGQNPSESNPNPSAAPAIIDRGRISGDSAGNVYFSFLTLPDPTLQRFDRFGYSAYQAAIPAALFEAGGRNTGQVQLGVGVSGMGWPTGISGWTDLHTLTSLSVANGMRRGMRGQPAAASNMGSGGSGQVSAQGDTLDFTADGQFENLAADLGETITPGLGDFGQGFMNPGMFGMGLPSGGFHEHIPGVFAEMRERPEGGGFGWHGHPGGFDFYRVTGAVRVNLDKNVSKDEKPVITATAVDPETQEAWAAVRDTLVHFDKTGSEFEIFYVAMTNGAALKPTALLIEPNRILIAADPWGIFEFPRPDKPLPPSAPSQVEAAPQNTPSTHRNPLRESGPTSR